MSAPPPPAYRRPLHSFASVHVGAIIGQGVTKTARIEHFVRHFQADHPLMSGILGCAHLNVFGEKNYAEYRNSKASFNDLGETQSPCIALVRQRKNRRDVRAGHKAPSFQN